MALFGNPTTFLGIDLGTSSIKLVELIDRKKRIELATYAEAALRNPILHAAPGQEEEAVRLAVNTISRMLEASHAVSDVVVAALPSTIVFSTVITLPDLPDEAMDKAVKFAARDVVPSDLEEMVLGWSRVASQPHMQTDVKLSAPPESAKASTTPAASADTKKIPIFLTAAPQNIVGRYIEVMNQLNLKIHSLEVETFPLVRALLPSPQDNAFIVDLGSEATTFHIIDAGVPRVSHTIEHGARDITKSIAAATGVSEVEAEHQKVGYGLGKDTPAPIRAAIEAGLRVQTDKAISLLRLYQEKSGRPVKKAILIGGGANLKQISDYWSKQTGQATSVGNPWRGLSAPETLEGKLQEIGPNYAVAVGLALRGLKN